jgi:cation transport ATPase
MVILYYVKEGGRIMHFLKNQKVGFIAYIIVAVMTVVTLSLYISNVNKPYYEEMQMNVVFILVGALLAMLL